MHRFFSAELLPFEIPARLYARLIDWEERVYALFDCVDADFFDAELRQAEGRMSAERWSAAIERAPVYAVEINAAVTPAAAAAAWLETNDLEGMPEWQELILRPNPEGPADVYSNIAGDPEPADLTVQQAPKKTADALTLAVDLTNDVVTNEAMLAGMLPSSAIEQIFVLDVGQGSANALVDSTGEVVAYVDLGAGILKHAKTWPISPMTVCLKHQPTIILTHWHYDHFEAANKFPSSHSLTWIAPLQTLGPGPQSAMATALRRTGGLKVWHGAPKARLRNGAVEIERCTGTNPKNQNRNGIAVWVDGPNRGDDPILLPGDAGYKDIDSLAGRAIAGLVVAHHGGTAPGTPPAKPLAGARPALAFSFGSGNKHNHPLATSLTALNDPSLGWVVTKPPTPPVDERRTEDRTTTSGLHTTGGAGLGHIRLDWAGGTSPPHACTCGCTLDPTQ